MKLSVFIIFPVLWCFDVCLAKPFEQGSLVVTEAVLDVTPYPDAQKRYVDINNFSPEVVNILKQNDLNLADIKSMQERLQNKTDKNFYQVIQSSTYPAPTENSDEAIRLNNIKHSLAKTLRETDDGELQGNAEFDYNIAAVCDIPRPIPIGDWFGQSTWNILFRPNYRQYNIKRVILRLFKVAVAVGKSSSKECDPPMEFYKFTVSVYLRKRKELKKKIIYTQFVANNFNGWLEIDVLATLKYWDQPKNNLGMAIDIYDKDDNQLDAKEHFHLQNCEADLQLPWGVFKLLAEPVRDAASENAVEVYRNLYTGPRLDLTSYHPANYHISSSEHQQTETEEKSTRHLRHTHHHRFQKSNEEVIEKLEHKSHQKNVERRDRSHRDSNQVEET